MASTTTPPLAASCKELLIPKDATGAPGNWLAAWSGQRQNMLRRRKERSIGAFLKCVSGLSMLFSNVFLQVVISALFKSKRAMSAESWRLPRRLGQFWHPAQWLARHTLLTRWDIFYIICDASYFKHYIIHYIKHYTFLTSCSVTQPVNNTEIHFACKAWNRFPKKSIALQCCMQHFP